MSGYASRKDLSTGVHDPLSARAVAFEVGGKRLVLVSMDIIGFYGGTDEYMRKATLAKEFNLQPSELFSGPFTRTPHRVRRSTRERNNASNVEYIEALKGKLHRRDSQGA